MIRMLQSHYILIFSLLFSLPIIFFFAPHFISPHPRQLPIPLPDELDDLSLFNHAVSSSISSKKAFTFAKLGSHNPTLKIAFLFLTNTDLFFAPLWDQFFNSTSSKFYNIYIHADPDSHIKDPGGIFKGKFIPSKHTERSSATLISAAKRLMATAILDDPLNFYFALVSQSCIPLHSFDYVYKTLMGSSSNGFGFHRERHKSFIEILDHESTLPSRYVARGKNVMMPEVPFEEFRVGSQFFVLNKKHALMVLKDRKLWRKFRLPCFKIESCYPEEHYFPTLLSMQDLNGCTKYTVTRVNWTESVNGHPHMYSPPDVFPELIYTLRQSNYSHDYLFARKFSPDSLKPLMDMADSVIFND
ncbi:glycosyltransferase BC10 [Amaranthus tricolor]|uniref:glycosyltransferase BC10 n=1 Tax=Amaranthus tricolor TaxID=29722 RepID=UPI00258F6866|nr:glycosyltransferase BC10 [Amaranthus tricolor]XP_057548932.1 glycosyltransferase BC10 [Amaranthus tricolor]